MTTFGVREASYPDAVHLLATLARPDAPAEAALRAWHIGPAGWSELELVIA